MAENYKNDVEKLKHHLTILLDAETSLPAEQIDTQKAGRILELMELCDGRAATDGMEDFAARFNARCQTSVEVLCPPKKHGFASRFLKMAACFLLFFSLFCGTEFIAVKAFDFSIIQFFRITANRLVFEIDAPTPGQEGAIPSGSYHDYESLSESLGRNFLVPDSGMPESLKLESITYNEFSDSFAAAYQGHGSYAIWEAYLPVGQGIVDFNRQGLTAIEENMAAGDKTVSIYQTQADGRKTYTATFVYAGILYVLESDLPLEQITTIIEKAKSINSP